MDEMLERKIDQPRTGGNTAWVPAPYPSDIHAMHYHMVDVDQVQRTMEDSPALNIPRRALLTFPLLDQDKLHAPATKRDLLLRYLHSMMAYVTPWVHRGIGCSGVLNFDQIEEMKDRATERIDSALIANWKLHNVITQEDIENAVRETARIVDEQNADSPAHLAMTDTQEKRDNLMKDPAVMAVLQIIEEALSSTSAYVEPALFRNRRTFKANAG
jgi:malate synthase